MLKKLSLRFSIAAIGALFVIELLMILLINGLNYRYTLKQTDELYEKATAEQRNAWNTNFRHSYSRYLQKKQHRA